MSLYFENHQLKMAMYAFVLSAATLFPAGLVNALSVDEVSVDEVSVDEISVGEIKINTKAFKPATSAPVVTKAPPSPSRLNSGLSGNRYIVGIKDTLWGIARQVRSSVATIEQTMITIQRDNPSAFENANINQLLNGAVLDLPSAQEVAAFDDQIAIQEVKQQNQSWRSKSLTNLPLDASKSADCTNILSLNTSRISHIGDRTPSKASADLIVTEEKLHQQIRERQQLQMLTVELQKQIDTFQNLIELKDDQIYRLKNSQPNIQSRAEKTVYGEPEVGALHTAMLELSLIDVLKTNLSYMLAALLAIVCGVYFFMERRSAAKADEIDDYKKEYTGNNKDEITQANNNIASSAEVAQVPIAETENLKVSASETYQGVRYQTVAEDDEEISFASTADFRIEGLKDQSESDPEFVLTFNKILSLDDELGDNVEEDMNTRLELAKAYLEIGDEDTAEEILSKIPPQV